MDLNYTGILNFLTIVEYMNMNKVNSELYISTSLKPLHFPPGRGTWHYFVLSE